jgi:uncharacterized protein (DUF1501 family)
VIAALGLSGRHLDLGLSTQPGLTGQFPELHAELLAGNPMLRPGRPVRRLVVAGVGFEPT